MAVVLHLFILIVPGTSAENGIGLNRTSGGFDGGFESVYDEDIGCVRIFLPLFYVLTA